MTPRKPRICIGIDGGGTGCRIAMRTSATAPIIEGNGGAANIMTDPDATIRHVVSAVHALVSKSDPGQSALDDVRIHLGLAGVVDTRHDLALQQAFPNSSVTVSDDRLTTLAGALGDVDGVVAGIGTGSFVGRRFAQGVHFVGGWGGIVGDQASGAWLGKRLLEETLKAHDGLVAATALTDLVLSEFEGPVGLVSFARTARPGDFAGYAPKVVERQDDQLAQALLREGAGYILAAFGALGASPGERVVLTGGLGRFYKPVLPAKWTAGLADPAGTALDGALRLAERHG